MEELTEVIVLTDGAPPRPHIPCIVLDTHVDGSIGRTGSGRGTVKYPFGLGSQHLATTSIIGLKQNFTHDDIGTRAHLLSAFKTLARITRAHSFPRTAEF